MNQIPKSRKAIALMSGGLDSALAAKIIKDQGIEVVGLHLLSPFGCAEEIEKVAQGIEIPLLIKEKGEAYIDLVENPRYGYGRNMNPCIDCRIFMFQLADLVRQDLEADFIVTGEVLGQRPMSQQRKSIHLIDSNSPLGDRLVRPLSAHHFDPSLPEREGWIDRENLLNISGRGRKQQIALAAELKIPFYSSPAGGCLLTDANFSKRLRDFFDHKTHTSSEERMAQAEMIRVGRHFRFSDTSKTILARNHQENLTLRKLWPQSKGTLVCPSNFEGPIAILFGEVTEGPLQLTAQLIARYGKSGALHSSSKTLGTSDALHPFEFSSEEPNQPARHFSFREPLHATELERYRL